MAIIAKNAGGDYALPPPGTHIARCCFVVDLGTQKNDFPGKSGTVPKVRIGFELPEELHVFREENGPEPFTLSKKFTCLLGERANLRKALESWRGRPFTPKELESFDVSKLLGVAAMVTVIHKPGARDVTRIFADLSQITAPPKSSKCPPPIQEPILYEIGMRKGGTYPKLPEWIQKEVDAAMEFSEPPAAHAGQEEPGPDDVDVPF